MQLYYVSILKRKCWINCEQVYDITLFQKSKMWIRLWNQSNAIFLFLLTHIYSNDFSFIIAYPRSSNKILNMFIFLLISSLGWGLSMLLDFSKNCLLNLFSWLHWFHYLPTGSYISINFVNFLIFSNVLGWV